MKIFVLSNDLNTQKMASKLGEVSIHYCTKEVESIAKEQVVLELNGKYETACIDILMQEIDRESILVVSSEFKFLGALMAGKMKAPILSECIEIGNDNGIWGECLAYGGALIRRVEIGAFGIIALSPNCQSIENDFSDFCEKKRTLSVSEESGPKVIDSKEKQKSDADLRKAKVILAVGRGFEKIEDLDLAYVLAEKIDAQIACSRPIAETEQWIEKSRYVGISGNIVSPDVYIAVGISGQIQHMIGCKDAKKIIVINKDDKAPVFKYADLGIVGDLREILKVL